MRFREERRKEKEQTLESVWEFNSFIKSKQTTLGLSVKEENGEGKIELNRFKMGQEVWFTE